MQRSVRTLVLAGTVVLLATAPAQAGQIVVKPKPRASAPALDRLLGPATTVGRVTRQGATVLRVPGTGDALIGALRASGLVEYAERDRTLRIAATPNDARFGGLYGLENSGQDGGVTDADIDAPEGWDAFGLESFPTALTGVKVGIVDTGIRRSHEDFGSGRVVDCAATSPGLLLGLFGSPVPAESRGCDDRNGHGTHIAGTIAATANNGVGVAGVAFTSPLSICKALHGAAGSGPTSGVANCITYLTDRGAKVISLSLGGGNSSTLRQAVDYAVQRDVLVIAAAGNEGDDTLSFPAAHPDVVSVAATDRRDLRARFSNANDDVEIAAPGVGVLSTWNTSDTAYRALSGTSMATPHVAAAAALIRGRAPFATASAARAKLQTSVDDLGPAGRDPQHGFGRLNLAKAGS